MNELTIIVIMLAAAAFLFIAYCSLLDAAVYMQHYKLLAVRSRPRARFR